MSQERQQTPKSAFDVFNLSVATDTMIEILPPLWKKMYDKIKGVGFREEEAFAVLQTFILSQSPFGINGVRK